MALTPQGIVGLWVLAGFVVGIAAGVVTGQLVVAVPLGVAAGFLGGSVQTRGRSGTLEELEREAAEAAAARAAEEE